jgi:D-3-phosphoglycerate dehydrogenase
MKSLSVLRVNLSPYQHPDFMRMERSLLEGLPGIHYLRPGEPLGERQIVLITNTHTVLRELPSGLLEQTGLILHPNSGHDHFTQDHALWKDIPLVVGHEIRAQAVAEWSLGCLFSGLQELPQHLSWNKQRTWERTLIKGLGICIFGQGHIGKIVGATLTALGAQVSFIDPYKPSSHKTWKELDLKKMKVVISCMGLNSTSRHLFNEEFFNCAHEELIFINGARGGLVVEEALKGFLHSHPGAFAFLDVFEKEPFGAEWQNFPQVWKTSHIAGVHANLDQGILDFEYKVLKDHLELSAPNFMSKYQQELLQNKWIQGALI